MHPFDETLLDDPGRRDEVDRTDYLRSLAGAGALVREVTGRVDGDLAEPLRRLAADRPRAVHVVAVGGTRLAADLACSLTRHSGVLVTTGAGSALPGWIGPLDLVVAISLSGAADGPVAQAYEAARRGASVLTVGAPGGPLADAAARARGVHVEVTGRSDHTHRVARSRTAAWAAAVPVLRALQLAGLLEAGATPFDELADTLDEVAERARPDAEYFVNPAKTLALDLADRSPLVLADGPVTSVAASRAAAMLHRTSRVPASWGRLPDDAGEIVACLSGPAAGSPDGSGGGVFADPYLDGAAPARPLALALLREPEGVEAEGVDHSLTRSVRRAAERSGVRVVEQHARPGADLVRVASLAAMLDLATAYIALGHGLDPGRVPGLDDITGERA
ncbi:SIS domain-containing protein [Janibacter melonis]|uniref:SIS domain-containing protein n=1 Tax=Janibacter melonis TaxID=262209 RepID=UPI001E4EF634|nr:SIS domain-containing protein [Janibacter melonis]MCB5992796.1 phosphosugar isomerase [Janibacter melonis]